MKSLFKRKNIFISILLCFALAAVIWRSYSFSASESNEVILYTCMSEAREEALVEQLKKQFHGYTITQTHYGTGDCGAKLLAEGTNTEADIVVGLQCASLETVLDSLADVSSYKTAEYSRPQLNPDHGKYWVWEKYDGAFVVNSTVLEQEHLPIPTSYEDLLNPAYKDWIVMPDPRSSGAGYMFLNNWYNIWGEDKAFEYMDELENNVSQFVSSGHNVTQLLVNGDAAIGFIDLMNIYKQIADGANLEIIVPDTGAPYNITGTAIISGKENKKPVQDVYEWLMSEYVVDDNSNFSPGYIFVEQEQVIEGYPANVEMANMDTITDMELKTYLNEKWNY